LEVGESFWGLPGNNAGFGTILAGDNGRKVLSLSPSKIGPSSSAAGVFFRSFATQFGDYLVIITVLARFLQVVLLGK
jgi:hypothetical protein